eukprot:TRINITY_DN1682_c0_g1_i2.p1 TRINITY_DN1682_c0_g1~~TRINITY_DN1682_c0_g1_i2.p1  ORF type:complete len:225 (-),score=27.00 TRINITY_DN1682_c0_g1_i2:17-691(-)
MVKIWDGDLTWCSRMMERGPARGVLQVLWNDRAGKFPGDEGCERNVLSRQWVLDMNREKVSRNEEFLVLCYHCRKVPCVSMLCNECKEKPELINDGKSHGSTCPDCFQRVQGSTLVAWLYAVEEHNRYCEQHPETWNPDRTYIDCSIIHPLCKIIASKCYQLQIKQAYEISDTYIFSMLQEVAKVKYNINLTALSRITQEGMVKNVCQILHKFHRRKLKKSMSF